MTSSKKARAGALGSTFMKLKTNFVMFFSKGKHRLHNPSHWVSLYNLYFMFKLVYLCIGVIWSLVAL
jgi:hypothetical protein